MSFERTYDPTIKAVSEMFPLFDIKDAPGTRATLAAMLAGAAEMGVERPSDPNIEEIERTIPGPDGAPDVAIRIYMPKDRSEPGPGFVNFHGGGFILGDLESEHARCLVMAQAGAVAVGIDYRLAPEHMFPAGAEDCYAGLKWVAENSAELKIDPTKIAVGGGSAGGNLAAAVALMARDRSGPHIAFQVLLYPVTDDRCETPSMNAGDGLYIWDRQNSIDMWNQYIGTDRSNVSPYAAPMRAGDLSGLPPAYVMTAEHDPLRDEGILYALRMMQAGVQVELHCYPGTVHGFDFLAPSDVSARAVEEGVAACMRALA